MENTTKVFISYAWNKKTKNFVDWLYRFLSDDNDILQPKLTIFMDRNSTNPGDNLNSFMTDTLTNSDFVICLLDNEYLKRINQPGTGVFKEFKEIRENQGNIQIIPIHVSGQDQPSGFFGSLKYITVNIENLSDPANTIAYKQLLDTLFPNSDTVNALKPDSYRQKINDLKKDAYIQENTNFNLSLSGISKINISVNKGRFIFGQGQQEFLTEWSSANKESVYSYNVPTSDPSKKRYLWVCSNTDYEDINTPEDIGKAKQYYDWGTEALYSGSILAWINEYEIMMVGEILSIENKCLELRYKII